MDGEFLHLAASDKAEYRAVISATLSLYASNCVKISFKYLLIVTSCEQLHKPNVDISASNDQFQLLSFTDTDIRTTRNLDSIIIWHMYTIITSDASCIFHPGCM